MDYRFLGESYGEAKYILVLKVELNHYCEHVAAADSANSHTAVAAILNWHKRFGVFAMWMSDIGTHSKCQVMEERLESLAFCFGLNAVNQRYRERVNSDILQVLTVMLLESQLGTRNRAYPLPGLPAPSALDVVVPPGEKLPRTFPLGKVSFRQALEE
ncbi:hypothetical protein CCR75_004873 [Bremia lactucae]|uniref:Uncharacterized protein n=1 Tax=Bremia lactucae TaxID=4779 RepID=A0A976IHN9_BRELC|nr:hypothetical protein CCR75_004873 [Bremia lactucae]